VPKAVLAWRAAGFDAVRGAAALAASVCIAVGNVAAAGPAPAAVAAADLDDEVEDALIAVPSTDAAKPAAGALAKAPAPIEAARSEPWAVPPIPWRGNLTLELDRYKQGDLPAQGATTTRLGVNGSSFVLAPWFLRLTGGGAVTQTKTTENQRSESANATLSGAYLSQSRYPGAVGANVGRSTTGDSVADFRSLNWTHSYQPEDSSYLSNLSYNLSNVSSGGAASTTSQYLAGAINFRVPSESPQAASLSGSLSRTEASGGAGGSNGQSLNGSHSIYFEDYVLTVASDAAFNRTMAEGAEQLESRLLSAGSQMDWVPSDDYPLRLRGSVRHVAARSIASARASSDLSSTLAVLGADYPHDRNWVFTGAATASRAESGVEGSSTYTASAGATWSGDPFARKIGDWDYGLGYRASGSGDYGASKGSAVSGSGSSAAVGLTGGVSQTLGRLLATDRLGINPNLRLTQDVNAVRVVGSRRANSTVQLNHGATFSTSLSTSARSPMEASANVSDGRSFGDSRSVYQTINGAINGSLGMGIRETFTYYARIGYSRQGSAGVFAPWIGGANGVAAYTNTRFADVGGLVYSASYSIYARERSQDTPFGSGIGIDHVFTQAWSWRLGLLSWAVSNTLSRDSNGQMYGLVRLSLSRDFGGVL
jgi:hypothetical protein